MEKQTALLYAIKHNLPDKLKELIDTGADVNYVLPKGGNLIMAAICRKSTTLIPELILAGTNVNYKSFRCNTPLILASKKSIIDVSKFLIESGADVNAQNYRGYTPLIYASRNNDVNMVKLLIESGANVNITNMYGDNALITHCKNRRLNIDIIRLLINAKTDINATNRESDTALAECVLEENISAEIVKIFIDAGANVAILNLLKCNALINYCSTINICSKIIKLLVYTVNINCYIDDVDMNGDTALLYLTDRCYADSLFDSIKILVDANCNTDLRDNYKRSALHHAVKNNNPKVVKLLLDAGANINLRDSYDKLPIDYATKIGNNDIITMINNRCNAGFVCDKNILANSTFTHAKIATSLVNGENAISVKMWDPIRKAWYTNFLYNTDNFALRIPQNNAKIEYHILPIGSVFGWIFKIRATEEKYIKFPRDTIINVDDTELMLGDIYRVSAD